MNRLKAVSLFANIGVAEAYLKDIGIDVVVANEIDKKRVGFYKYVYPDTNMIQGDITDKEVFNEVVKSAKNENVDILLATPPCQGMSTAGKKDPNDSRNKLITYAIEAIKEIEPKFIFLENVPQQLRTRINYKDEMILIPEYIKAELNEKYNIKNSVINSVNYGVAQSRERSIFIMVRKDIDVEWEFPKPEEEVLTLKDAIGSLPDIDPIIQGFSEKEILEIFPDFKDKETKGKQISKWHKPPTHKIRHVNVMRYTPEGKSALENEVHYPKKENGERIVGFKNTYKRQWWDKPAYTVTTYNGAVCSHDNVHPGRPIGKDKDGFEIYSNPRVLTIYELMLVTSLPMDWNIPDNTPESLIRKGIGEGIPSLVVKKIFDNLIKNI